MNPVWPIARGDRRVPHDEVVSIVSQASARELPGTVVIDFRVVAEDIVYPMVPANADLRDMIRRPAPARFIED